MKAVATLRTMRKLETLNNKSSDSEAEIGYFVCQPIKVI